ncbi:hypothetical protein Q8G43_14200 [Acinetobacter schindleri]|uniref:hypothetical protein n=1 Tax=Acinetobacter schindleri TaxID=108981 RepID=UPI00272F0E49|nr:hypothetical protein [Acinetobacter schindleri]MDP1446087.1 hypothetical protein [Acinetobacter schindleri]
MTIENKYTPYAQRGFATVLIVLLVGLAVAASALGTAYYINSSQKSLVSSHALTNAQSGAWTGVEIFRKYLDILDEAGIASLNKQNLTLKVQGGRELKVNNISSVETNNNPKQYRVTANIQNISEKSEASSTIQIVYEVLLDSDASSENSNSSGTTSLKGAMNFYGGLTATGDIDLSNAGQKAIINVEGNINKTSGGGGVSLKGVKRLNATGSVELGAETKVEEVYSNKYIIIDGSAAVTKIASALQYIKMKSASSQGDLIAGNSDKIALNEIKKEDVYVTTENSGYVNSINTLNNTYIKNGGSKLGTLIAGGNVTCPKTSWQNYTVMRALSFDSSCSTSKRSGLDGITPLNAIEVTEISTSTKPIVNALSSQYKASVEYIFYYDSQDKIEKVDVRDNFSNTTPTYTTYQLDKKNGFLCKTLNTSKQCSNPVIKLAPKLKSQGTDFIQYDQTKKLWTVTESSPNWSEGASLTPSLVPSVVLFNGNLNLSLGRFTNTFLATGDITYGGSVTLYAPNYAGDAKVCQLDSVYKVQSNLCSSGKLTNLPVANIALLAGSCTDDSSVMTCQGSYNGGTITIGQSAKVYGNIIAGNILNTGGSTTIYGSVLAAALGNAGSGSNLQESTKIDFNGISDEQTTITLPNNSANESEDEVAPEKVKIKWARYL